MLRPEWQIAGGTARDDGSPAPAADPVVLRPEWQVGDRASPPDVLETPEAGCIGAPPPAPPLVSPAPVDVTASVASAPDVTPAAPPPRDPAAAARAWEAIESVAPNTRHLRKRRLISFGRTDPAHMAFDHLRTRAMQAMRERGWRRIGITSPTAGCGKTFVASNLALSIARQGSVRTVLCDFDLRRPNLGKSFGIRRGKDMRRLLGAETPPSEFLLRVTPNLALALNDAPVSDSAELLQDPATAACLSRIEAEFEPGIMLFDLPPMLVCDDTIALMPLLDTLLLVIGGGITLAAHVRDCERLIGEDRQFLGMVMNRAEDASSVSYGGYGY